MSPAVNAAASVLRDSLRDFDTARDALAVAKAILEVRVADTVAAGEALRAALAAEDRVIAATETLSEGS